MDLDLNKNYFVMYGLHDGGLSSRPVNLAYHVDLTPIVSGQMFNIVTDGMVIPLSTVAAAAPVSQSVI